MYTLIYLAFISFYSLIFLSLFERKHQFPHFPPSFSIMIDLKFWEAFRIFPEKANTTSNLKAGLAEPGPEWPDQDPIPKKTGYGSALKNRIPIKTKLKKNGSGHDQNTQNYISDPGWKSYKTFSFFNGMVLISAIHNLAYMGRALWCYQFVC